MISFDWLKNAGAAEAFMTDIGDGDCGWEGCAGRSRAAFLEQSPVPPEKLVALRQCHGDRIVTVAASDAGRGARDSTSALAEADGMITAEPGIPLGINVADCVPVFLYAPGACALVHAGRAGTAQQIAAQAVTALSSRFGVPPSSLFALIGPSAGPCCYEVSADARAACVAQGMAARGNHLDLWLSNRGQLRGAGVPDAHIHVTEWCTICQPGFFSYRAQGTASRNLAVIMR